MELEGESQGKMLQVPDIIVRATNANLHKFVQHFQIGTRTPDRMYTKHILSSMKKLKTQKNTIKFSDPQKTRLKH